MDIDGKKPTFPDGVKLKTNDLLSLQTQLTNLVQALSNMFSDGVISGLTIEQIGDYPTYINGNWDYGTGSVRIHGGMAKAENGELLVIEDRQIPDIPNTLFWDQTNIGPSGRDIWIYRDDVEIIKIRPNIIGISKSVLERNVYKIAYGNPPSKQPCFKLCTVNQLVPVYNISIQNSVKINYALKSLIHTNSLFNNTIYTGPKLNGYEALNDGSIQYEQIADRAIQNINIAPKTIGYNRFAPSVVPTVVLPRIIKMPMYDPTTKKYYIKYFEGEYKTSTNESQHITTAEGSEYYAYQFDGEYYSTSLNRIVMNSLTLMPESLRSQHALFIANSARLYPYKSNIVMSYETDLYGFDTSNFNDSIIANRFMYNRLSALWGIGIITDKVLTNRQIPFIKKIPNSIPRLLGYPDAIKIEFLFPYSFSYDNSTLFSLPIYAPDGYVIESVHVSVSDVSIDKYNINLTNWPPASPYTANNTNIIKDFRIRYAFDIKIQATSAFATTGMYISVLLSKLPDKYSNDNINFYFTTNYNDIPDLTINSYTLQSRDIPMQVPQRPDLDMIYGDIAIPMWKSYIDNIL